VIVTVRVFIVTKCCTQLRLTDSTNRWIPAA